MLGWSHVKVNRAAAGPTSAFHLEGPSCISCHAVLAVCCCIIRSRAGNGEAILQQKYMLQTKLLIGMLSVMMDISALLTSFYATKKKNIFLNLNFFCCQTPEFLSENVVLAFIP